jgi:deoxyribonuclease IV
LGADPSGSHAGGGEKRGVEKLTEGLNRARELAGDRAAEPVIENSVGAGTQRAPLSMPFCSGGGEGRGTGVRGHGARVRRGLRLLDAGKRPGDCARAQDDLGDHIVLLHLNDPRNEPGSHRDGHERIIGEGGQTSEEAWTEFFAALRYVPVVTETLYATPEVDAKQVRLAKALAGGLLLSPGGV